MSSFIKACLAEVCIVAALWLGMFKLNQWLFSAIGISSFIGWIFLPAAVRVLSVLVADWRAVIGLFIGTVVTCNPVVGINMLDSLTLGLISATSPMIAVRLSTRFLRTQPDLKMMNFTQLAIISAFGGIVSATLHNGYFHLRDSDHHWMPNLVPMLTGDLAGTLLVLFFSGLILRRLKLDELPY